jgi:hypothetical protein
MALRASPVGPDISASTFAALLANAERVAAKSGDTVIQTKKANTAGSDGTAVFDTDQGSKVLNIDAYFTPGDPSNVWTESSIPPLLAPTQNNINAISRHVSAALPRFLSDNKIPYGPASISYDNSGQMQLPFDYPYAAQFKEAMANHPTMANELSAVVALTFSMTEMNKSVAFQEEYAAASTKAGIDAILAKYSYLFSSNHAAEPISLQFATNGRLSVTVNGRPLS